MSMPPPNNVTIRVSAPGKVILHGEHSVVYDKLALAASLGLRTRLEFCEIEPTTNNVISLDFPALNLMHVYSLQDIQDLLDRPLPLSKGPSHYNFTHPELLAHEDFLDAINAFIQEKGGTHPFDDRQQQALAAFFYIFWGILGSMDFEIKQFQLKTDTDLTISAGTGSSASFLVTIAAFAIQFIRTKRCKSKSSYKSVKVNVWNLDTFDKAELEWISKWAFQAEKIIHGTPSGVDNTVCTYGSMVEFRRGFSPKLVEITTKFRLILINTNVPRDTKAQVKKVALMRSKHKMIVDGLLELMDVTAMNALNYIKKINGRMGDEFDMLEHYENLGEFVDINQNLLRSVGVSHPKLDEACQILTENGLHGKMTGAGGGGYAICLVPPYIQKAVVDKVIDELNSKGFKAVLTDLGGDGVALNF